MIIGMLAVLAVFVADQISKTYLMALFTEDPTVRILTPYFNLVRAWNTGVSFSMFDQGGYVGTLFLTGFALAVVGFLFFWLYREKDRPTQMALGLIIGGALGNVIDRIRFGAVYDFLDFHYAGYHWPAFNVADTFICIGAGLILLREFYLRSRKNSERRS